MTTLHTLGVRRAARVAQVLGLLVAACATAGAQEASQIAQNMGSFRREMTIAPEQTTRTLGALNALLASPGPDYGKPYARYVKELRSLELHASAVTELARLMDRDGMAFFQPWERKSRELSNPPADESARQRRLALSGRYGQIIASVRQAKTSLAPLMSDLGTVRNRLDQDLTATGVAGIAVPAISANKNLAAVQESFRRINAEMDRLAELWPR